ncbi:MAG: hypothetical protein ACRC3B_07790 [Bacteroidia bacterium]
MDRLHLRLFWEGTWDLSSRLVAESVPSTPGIYTVFAPRKPGLIAHDHPDAYELLYIGESENIRHALIKSKKWNIWERKSATGQLLLRITKTDHVLCRRTIAAVLAFQNKPVCNSRFVNISLFRYVHVTVSNFGAYMPLMNDAEQHYQHQQPPSEFQAMA